MKLSELEDALPIDKHDLDEAHVRQPQLFYEVSKGLAEANANAEMAKLAKEQTYAELDQVIRDQAGAASEKITEPGVKQAIVRHPKMQKAETLLIQTKRIAENWQGMMDAFRQRSYHLKGLVELYTANYFVSESGGKAAGAAREGAAARIRATAAEVRRQGRNRGD